MFIPYNFLLKLNIFHEFFYRKKIEQNCTYIAKNKKKVLKKLKNKKVLRVVFYVYDSCKWKCQTIYEEMLKSPRFEPLIVVTKNSARNLDNPSFQSKDEILETFDFFKKRNMKVEFGYNFEKNKHIPFKQFNPDIIIYQHPWYVETSQGPVVCSKFALTAYVPYDIPTTTLETEYNLRFYQYVENFYVLNEKLKKFYASRMINKGINLKAVGAPSLEYIEEHQDGEFVIYAPHWTINHKKTMAYSTFKENGKFILDYAKKHPQIKWVFKPHPMLKKAILDNGFMTKQEVEEYYFEWEKIGIGCYTGDYFDIFNNSKAMITDCSTFLIEYLMTGKPLINIISNNATEFNDVLKDVLNGYYKSNDNEELKKLLDSILLENKDDLKTDRTRLKQHFKQNTVKKIIKNLLKQIEEV